MKLMNTYLRKIKHYDFGIKLNEVDPSIYLQSQIHGNETLSTLVLHNLINRLSELDTTLFRGAIRIVPRANPFSWDSYLHSRQGVFNITTGENWNRIFDWDCVSKYPKKDTEPSTLTKLLAQQISIEKNTTKLLQYYLLSLSIGYNHIVDVHTPENGIPHLYCYRLLNNIPTFGINYVIEYQSEIINTFDDAHNRINHYYDKLQNNNAITIELDSNIPASQKLVEKWTDTFMDEFKKIGVIQNYLNAESIIQAKNKIGKVRDFQTPIPGIQKHYFNLGEVVKENAPLFSILPFDLQKEIIIKAKSNCIPICLRKDTIVQPGAWVVRVFDI